MIKTVIKLGAGAMILSTLFGPGIFTSDEAKDKAASLQQKMRGQVAAATEQKKDGSEKQKVEVSGGDLGIFEVTLPEKEALRQVFGTTLKKTGQELQRLGEVVDDEG